ncbi:adenine-specific DNA-methyltransferase [Fibrobacter sp. UWH9]|uniref:DNA methyltransferase n=1 Tax=Fibrobacter sp. UWH9 TaxID=1896213 RepID=UPI000920FE88|nr:DNA methyltransferase [Fibrobacter sp. UWH9]SHH46947.1 adenine-specific DNA-methyltransferase [Fibrobacter sp. UWH9]
MNELTNERLNRFIDLLKGIFELDKSDLDFGIYRIMNIRKEEIEKFLNDGLPKKVTEVLKPFATAGKDELLKRKDAIEKQAFDLGIEIANSPKLAEEYAEVNKALAGGTDLAALETDVYSALYSFFSRYYDEGDFISKRRYKEGVYAIPYEGEEVKLYWANQDQYYIKTSENFKDYVFTAQDWTVHFNLVDATTEQNNNKETDDKKREFMLFIENEEEYPGVKTFECDVEKKELIIRFVFDIPADKKIKYLDENYTKICDFIVKDHKELMTVLLTDISNDRKNSLTLIQKHLKGYVAKNTFDYFIHKDLGGFLTRELDFFIKNEVMHLDDLDTTNEARVSTYLAKVRAIKQVGKILIEFLAQIENFQKKLWLKKKFVVETNWCITLDKIDESFYDEIRNNKDQVKEWIEMYAIDEIVNDVEHQESFTNPPTIEFLKQNQNLIVDTKNFSDGFKEKLVASIDDLDENTNGVMFNGDNFQVLNFLQKRYNRQVNYCYIDPPYNTDSAPILYKNGYKDSSWNTLINDRIGLSKALLKDRSVYTVAIDDTEYNNVSFVLKDNFRNHRISTVTVVHNPKGSPTKDFNRVHEYAVFVTEESAKKSIARILEENEKPRKMRRWGENSKRSERKLSFYPVYVRNGKIVGVGSVPEDDFHPACKNEKMSDGTIAIWPIDQDGVERRWNFGLDSIEENFSRISVLNDSDCMLDLFVMFEETVPKTVWKGGEYDAGSYGNTLLIKMLGKKMFDFPKSINTVVKCIELSTDGNNEALVLDFFAGSGTTGHAVIEFNRNRKDSKRKYVLVEMGTYFDSVTRKRVQKAAYASLWDDGKPLNRNTGISQIIKYMRLESYEDALSNIELQKPQTEVSSLFGDEYLINYMLNIESKGSLLNVKAFKDPFDYSMKITEKNESKLRKVDVVETFNYLIGLTVIRQDATKYFSATAASNPEYEGAVDLKNDTNGKFAFRQIEGSLPDGRRALVIWRNINDNSLESNAALDAYFSKYRLNPQDREYDVIYVNGDNNLENLRTDNESWKVQMIETEFNARMFEEN